MIMRPLFWRVLVELPPSEEKSAGGIVLTEQVREADEHYLCVGKLVAVGELCFQRVVDGSLHYGRQQKPKIGDWVLYGRHAGQKIKQKDRTKPQYVVLSETDILGVVDDPSAIKSYS